METALAEYLTHAPVLIRLDDGEIVYWTKGCEELYGYTFADAQGRISHELLQTVFPEPLEKIDAKMCSVGEWRGRLRHTRKDGAHIWVETQWRRRYAVNQSRPIVIEQNTDVTERVAFERHRELLTLELDHRVKNTLAVVQGLARLSFQGPERVHAKQFEDRLLALAQAHNVLTREHWEKAGLRQILEDLVGAMQLAGRIELDGPDADLTPNSAVAYTLAFHELATNAMKHGALSTPGGRVDVTWRIFEENGERLRLVWRESGGPQVKPPTRRGFGSRLLERVVAQELGAPVTMHFEPTGLVCEVKGALQKAPVGILDPSS